MTKQDLIAALEKIHGDPEMEVITDLPINYCSGRQCKLRFKIERIKEYPQPQIVVIEL